MKLILYFETMFIDAFKRDIDEIHDQYHVEVERVLPDNSNELEVRENENEFWKKLKYYNSVVKIQTKMKINKINNEHIDNMNNIERRVYKIYLS